ncbi:hypothetical protein [Planctomyces sp. SH-PL62]|uniref:hypothetical protein n=1 Tax=Planctomyces sp. SH-PL62 TaxID=1636152 RepID=UPI00078EE5E4|nr:hypothetical protein [Planctomyces sp. SH-PL62]AMV40781.1 hypothetical protein VT85_25335 [Planctomyces sp. SH-PL62]
MFRSVIAAMGLAACLGTLGGCGGSGTTESITSATSENGPLAQVGQIYRAHWQLKDKAPTGPKDIATFADGNPEGVNAVKNGEIVVIWGVKLDDLSIEGDGDSADEVLAYEKATPEQGGYVLMKNRDIRKMTADEFKAAPKAAGTAAAPAGKSS